MVRRCTLVMQERPGHRTRCTLIFSIFAMSSGGTRVRQKPVIFLKPPYALMHISPGTTGTSMPLFGVCRGNKLAGETIQKNTTFGHKRRRQRQEERTTLPTHSSHISTDAQEQRQKKTNSSQV